MFVHALPPGQIQTLPMTPLEFGDVMYVGLILALAILTLILVLVRCTYFEQRSQTEVGV